MGCGCGGSGQRGRQAGAGSSERTLQSIGGWSGKKQQTSKERSAERRERQDALKNRKNT